MNALPPAHLLKNDRSPQNASSGGVIEKILGRLSWFYRIPLPPRAPPVLRYLCAILATAVAVEIRLLLSPILVDNFVYSFFFPVVLMVGWFLGSGAGVLSLVLAYLATDYFFVEPLHSFIPAGSSEFATLTVFLFSGFLCLFALSALRFYMHTCKAAHHFRLALEEEVRQRKLAQENAQLAARQLADLNGSLEKIVNVRTRALLQTTEDLNSFCYSIAHDLKAPIRAQVSFAELLLAEYSVKMGESGSSMVRRIAEAAQRQGRLVDDLLAHLSVTRAEQTLEPVRLRHLTAQVLSDLRSQLRAHAATVNSTGLADFQVLANPASLALALQNLVANACKFVARGIHPDIKIWSELKDGAVILSVCDNGIGIAPEYHERIFEVFHRLHTAASYPGNGIGLAIVKRAVERMNGHVGLHSEPGKGSTFWIELPIAEPAVSPVAAAPAAELLVEAKP